MLNLKLYLRSLYSTLTWPGTLQLSSVLMTDHSNLRLLERHCLMLFFQKWRLSSGFIYSLYRIKTMCFRIFCCHGIIVSVHLMDSGIDSKCNYFRKLSNQLQKYESVVNSPTCKLFNILMKSLLFRWRFLLSARRIITDATNSLQEQSMIIAKSTSDVWKLTILSIFLTFVSQFI